MTTILVIEDNLEIRENTVEMLELEGYNVIAAMNGTIGVSSAIEHQPHLILCDIMMPELDGFRVFEQLKKNTATADIPLIFVTASVGKKEIEHGLSMGAAGYIRKPFEAEELFKAIDACLKNEKEP
jgi:CheY-like chemotaxis protein